MQIGSVEWLHDHWEPSYYPEGLPRDWWLTYYSNEFPCVLVAPDLARTDTATQWLADTHAEFRFFLYLRSLQESEWSAAVALARALGERLGGIVCDSAGLPPSDSETAKRLAGLGVHIAVDGAAADHPWIGAGIAGCVWRPDHAAAGCAVGIVSEPLRGDRRALRSCIETFAKQAGTDTNALFIGGRRPEVESVRDAGVIAGLLGV